MVFLGILLKACEVRPLPNEEDGAVRFVLEGKLEGKKIERKAGFDGQFLHTSYEREEELLVFSGSFGQEGCPNCPDAFEIRIRDLKENTLPDAVHMDSLFDTGAKKFFVKDGVEGRKKKKVFFTNESRSLGSPSYQWDFGDGTSSTQLNPVHTYEDPDLSAVRVCLETEDANGCTHLICNEISLGDSACTVNFSHVLDPNSTYVEFESEVSGAPPYDFAWSFGDGGQATLGNPGYFYPEKGKYEACLTLTDALGCTAILCKKIEVDPDLCEHNFSYRISSVPTKDVRQYGRVELVYTDEQGKVFTSSREEQPGNSFFEVLDRAPYEKNANGSDTYAFSCRFNCLLWDENGNSIRFQDGKAEAAVAYP